MNIIFLDIDGVLNDSETFKKDSLEKEMLFNIFPESERNYNLEYLLARKKIELDLTKLFLLKEITTITLSKVVFISSWIKTKTFPLIEDYFDSLGIPIQGTIDPLLTRERGIGIKEYIKIHNINNYIIIDDEIFSSYDDELKTHLIHTDFFNGGLTVEQTDEAIYRLRKR